MNEKVKKLVKIANDWAGKFFNPGATEQCAAFVRHVFRQAGVNLPNVAHPSDTHLLPHNTAYAPTFADSFAGNEIGMEVNPRDMMPGDIVMFSNTYGNFPAGVITHVGIYVGDDMIVDRPTADRPVQKRSVHKLGKIAEVRRPTLLYPSGMPSVNRAKLFYHDGIMSGFQAGHKMDFMEVNITMKPTLKVVVNHAVVSPKAILFEAEDLLAEKKVKLYYHDGMLKAFYNGSQVQNLEIKTQMAGNMLVCVNGRKIRPNTVKLEVVS